MANWHGKRWAWVSLVVAAGLLYLLTRLPAGSTARRAGLPDGARGELVVYCAAAVQPVLAEAAALFAEESFGLPVRLQYGGSGTLLNNLQISGRGDLYIAADASYMQPALDKGLVAETLPLATVRPVLAVAAGNPHGVQGLEDLWRDDLRLGLANPEAASIGKLSRALLEEQGVWDRIQPQIDVLKPTVPDLANDLLMGAIDVAILWDVNVAQQADRLDAIHLPAWDAAEQQATLGVLRSSRQPALALRFARYLQAPEKGGPIFARHHFQPVAGDPWEVTPRITFYSGGVNRLAIQETLSRFAAREGVHIDSVYNGCGILVSQMRSGARPDAYLACDKSFMQDVAQLFPGEQDVAETDMVIAVRQGNPRAIGDLLDLASRHVKLGVANAEQTALGALTQRLLSSIPSVGGSLYDAIQPQVVVQTPTADLLVNQLRAGALDAAIVYRANVPQSLVDLELVEITQAGARAVQPLGLWAETRYPALVQRLRQALLSAASRARFEETGFRWRGPTVAAP